MTFLPRKSSAAFFLSIAAHFAFKMSEFEAWLGDQLRQINTDESVFGQYIIGILEGDEETQEEKVEALEGILSDTGVSWRSLHIYINTYIYYLF